MPIATKLGRMVAYFKGFLPMLLDPLVNTEILPNFVEILWKRSFRRVSGDRNVREIAVFHAVYISNTTRPMDTKLG